MTTAFQPNAFQNNAFQIDLDGGAGSGRKKKRGLSQADVNRLLEEYKEALSANPEQEIQHKIISAVNPFIYPETEEEISRYQKAAFLFDEMPPPNRIDFDLLHKNKLSIERFRVALAQIRDAQEEEELLLMLLLTTKGDL